MRTWDAMLFWAILIIGVIVALVASTGAVSSGFHSGMHKLQAE